MNVIFLDFDGVLNTNHYKSKEDVERRIKILADICKEYDCKVVIEASAKSRIDEKTMEVHGERLKFIFNLFIKYGIECIGRTKDMRREISPGIYRYSRKEDEILEYLSSNPEIKHYCVIDDDDLADMHRKSDLDKVRDHLVKTEFYSDNPKEEGLLELHKEEVGRVLKKEII